MNIVIDNFDFLNMPAMKYWSYASSTPVSKRKAEAKVLVESGEYYGSVKRDGVWEMIIKDIEGNFYARSRTESVNGGFANKADFIPQIIEELNSIPNGTVLIGEIYFPNNEGSRKVTSVFNCLKNKCLERQKAKGFLHYYIFDILAYKGKSLINEPFEKRIEHYLNYELFDVLQNNNYVEVAEYKEGEELWDLYGSTIASGGEGIVITKKSAVYSPGKRPSKVTLKLKKELANTIDAFIDGNYKPPTKEYSGKTPLDQWSYWFNEKTGQCYTSCQYNDYFLGKPLIPVTKPFALGYAGSISFSVMKNGKPIHIGYISGVPDSMKAGIAKEPEKWIGKVFEISAMMVEKIDNNYSLRHAIVVQERIDKRPEDCEFSQVEDNV